MPAGRRNRSTTIITFASANAPGKILSRSITKPATRRVVQEDVLKPDRLSRMLNDMQEDIDEASEGIFSNPHAAPCILRGIVLQSGQSVTLYHTLGRPYTGFCSVRSQGSFAQLVEQALPAGLTADKAIQLQHTGLQQTTVDISITGD